MHAELFKVVQGFPDSSTTCLTVLGKKKEPRFQEYHARHRVKLFGWHREAKPLAML